MMASLAGIKPWAWASLPGLGTEDYWRHVRCWDGSWCNIDYAPMGAHWLTSERRPSLVCNQCGRSDAWHLEHLCEDDREYQRRGSR